MKAIFAPDLGGRHNNTILNSRQRLMLNKLLDGFDGKLKTSKWAKISKCSADTALRDMKDLIEKGILKQEEPGGRSTHYVLIEFILPGSANAQGIAKHKPRCVVPDFPQKPL